jgi:hypothetical protein
MSSPRAEPFQRGDAGFNKTREKNPFSNQPTTLRIELALRRENKLLTLKQ